MKAKERERNELGLFKEQKGDQSGWSAGWKR